MVLSRLVLEKILEGVWAGGLGLLIPVFLLVVRLGNIWLQLVAVSIRKLTFRGDKKE